MGWNMRHTPSKSLRGSHGWPSSSESTGERSAAWCCSTGSGGAGGRGVSGRHGVHCTACEVFAAAQFCIDTLKHTVPIWKREKWSGGTDWTLCS